MSRNLVRARAPKPGLLLQKVAIIDGSRDILDWLEAMLEPGCYEIVFLDDVRQAYTRVRELQPELIVLCARIEDTDAFQFLTMLKLDAETRAIPVQTYTTEWEGQVTDADLDEWWRDDPIETRSRRCLPLN
jgi:PleD family two-component response regulator